MKVIKLHELLAIATSLETQAKKVISDLAATFEKKRHLFEEKRVTFTPNAENSQVTVEAQSDIQTNVRKELEWVRGPIAKAIDAGFQIACANTEAKADIKLEDGTLIASNVPATALLELEKRVAEIAGLIAVIPTLDPAKGFTEDFTRANGIFAAREVVKTRTKKIKKPFVKYEATKEHPAQVDVLDEDVPVGTVRELEWSGLITPARKAELLAQCEEVGRAVRAARARANTVEIDREQTIANSLLNEIFA